MTDIDALINCVVDRFLQWRLPENFQPDAGISFEPDFNVGTPRPMKHRPTGTNLFSATQAEAMVKAIAGPEIEALLDALTTERAKVAALEAEVKRKPLHYRVMFIVSAPVLSPANQALIANPAHQQVISFDNRLDADIAAESYEARSVRGLTFTAIKLYQE